MKDLIDLIVKNIVTNPDEVQITTTQDEGATVFVVTVAPEDMGRIIGKSGKVIKSIRSIAHVVAIRNNTRYRINIAEVEGAQGAVQEDSGVEDEQPAQETEVPAEQDILIEVMEDTSKNE